MALKHNMASFMKETEREIKKELAKQESKAKTIVLTAYDSIVRLSPKDTGLFRSSNLIAINKIDNRVLEGVDSSRNDIAKHTIGNLKFRNGDTISIYNNSKYGNKLESGHSKQAPSGMYGVTEQRLKPLLNQKIK